MSSLVRTRAALPAPVTARRLTGSPAQIAARVSALRAEGRLQSMTLPVPADTGRVSVDVQLLRYAPAQLTAMRRRAVVRRALIVAAAVSLAAGAVFAAVHLLAAAVALWPSLAGCALLLGLLWLALSRAAGCPGLHCSGCSHH